MNSKKHMYFVCLSQGKNNRYIEFHLLTVASLLSAFTSEMSGICEEVHKTVDGHDVKNERSNGKLFRNLLAHRF